MYSIKINQKQLFLFLFILIGISPAFSQNVFKVRDYGATGNKDLCTGAIQKAIDACHEAGGGKVYFSPGEYVSGTIELKDNVTLHLEAGATLYASRDEADYPDKYTIYKKNDSGKKGKGTTPVLIYAKNRENIGIEGKGTIHGQAERVYEPLREVDGFIKKETEIARKAGVEMKMYYKVKPFVSMIFLESSRNIHIKDVSLIESEDWTLHFKWCKKVFVNNVYIESSLKKGVNADGIDIDGSSDVVVSDCIIQTGDDAIVLKSTVTFGRYENCENITVTNCSLTSTSSALKLGTESFGDFRHITFSNCAINNTNRGLGIIVRDGGTVSNVLFSDITMTLDRKHFNWWENADPIWLVVKKRNPDSKIGNIKNVVFENIVAHGQGTSKLEGYPGHPLKNITLNQVQFFMHPEDKPDKRATHCLQAHDIQGLKIKDCDITWDKDNPEKKWKSAVYLEKVNNFRVSGISAVQGAPDNDFPVFELSQVQNGRVYNCYAKEGSSTFVKVDGKNTRNIYFRDNFTDLASKDFNPGNEVKQETLHGIDR